MSAQSDEVILTQEQGVEMRAEGAKKELEAEFGVGVKQGTLILTSKKLAFVCTNEKEADIPSVAFPSKVAELRVYYSDVEDIKAVPKGPPNLFIPLSNVTKVEGHKGGLERPSLRVNFTDAHGAHELVFIEFLTGKRAKNLNDWATVIENLKEGRQRLTVLPPPPSIDTLEGKVLRVLSDMQDKGVFSIEEATEKEFKLDLDPDEVQSACDSLVGKGLVARLPDSGGEVFYRRMSPLGNP